MKISVSDEGTAVIEFSRQELEQCRLTYENISRNAIKSKTAIYTIITETAKLSGNERIIDENTVIDILPDGEGGCVIILNNVLPERAEAECAVLFSKDTDCFFDLARAMGGGGSFSSLYATPYGYALYLEGSSDFFVSCSEFCDVCRCTEAYRHRLDEYGRLLIDGNALEVLCGTAPEK